MFRSGGEEPKSIELDSSWVYNNIQTMFRSGGEEPESIELDSSWVYNNTRLCLGLGVRNQNLLNWTPAGFIITSSLCNHKIIHPNHQEGLPGWLIRNYNIVDNI